MTLARIYNKYFPEGIGCSLPKSLKQLLATNIASTGGSIAGSFSRARDLRFSDHSGHEMIVRARPSPISSPANCTAALSFNDGDDATHTLASLRFEPHVIEASVYDRSGKRLAGYLRDAHATLSPNDVAPGGYRFRDDALEVSCRVVLNGRVLGTADVQSDLALLHAAGAWLFHRLRNGRPWGNGGGAGPGGATYQADYRPGPAI